MLSGRTSTSMLAQKQYDVYLRRWVAFCDQGDISVFSPAVGELLHFLWQLYSDGLGFSAINTARSALSAVVSFDNMPAGQHPLVKRFVKATFQNRPALPKNNVVWDVDQVLDSRV